MQTDTPLSTTWTGEVEIKLIVRPTGKFTATGKEILTRSTLTKIFLRRGRDLIPFNVTRRNGCTSITDHREKATGLTGTTGIWGTRDTTSATAPKSGRCKSYTPTGWIAEVKRYVGEGEAKALLMEAGYDFPQ